MGQHWIHAARADGPLDLTHPPILQYAVIAGRLRLVGVAYLQPLDSVFRLDRIPGAERGWHVHGALSTTAHSHAPHAMVHAWIWSENPDGLFGVFHRGLPYLRLGLDPSAARLGTDPAAGYGLSLLIPETCDWES
jgi:hypothetical protein